MSYSDELGYILDRRPLYRGGVNSETLSAGKTLTGRDAIFQILKNDASGAVVITLVPEIDGAICWVHCTSTSAHGLEIKNDAAGAITTLSAGQAGLFVCDGTNWHNVIKA